MSNKRILIILEAEAATRVALATLERLEASGQLWQGHSQPLDSHDRVAAANAGYDYEHGRHVRILAALEIA